MCVNFFRPFLGIAVLPFLVRLYVGLTITMIFYDFSPSYNCYENCNFSQFSEILQFS